MWRLQGPAGLQVRLVGGGLCGDWGNFLTLQCSTAAVMQMCSGVLAGGTCSTPSRPYPCGFSRIVSHPYTPTYRIQAVDGVIDALTSAWDGSWALAGQPAGARRIFLMPFSIFYPRAHE